MIIEDNEKIRREEIAKLKELLTDVKLPKHYEFDKSCAEIWYSSMLSGRYKSCELRLLNDGIIAVALVDEEDYEKLKSCFENSETKFKLSVGEEYY